MFYSINFNFCHVLKIDGLKIPTVISNGSGFDVGLDDWDNEWINVDI